MLDPCQLSSSSTVCRSCPRLSERVRETNTQGVNYDTLLQLLVFFLLIIILFSLNQFMC